MKLSVAAAAIAFSGTALMFAPTAASAAQQAGKPQATAKVGWDGGAKADMAGKDGLSGKGDGMSAKLETMDYDGMGGPLEEASAKDATSDTSDTSGKLASADVDGKFDTADMDVSGKFASAEMDMAGSDKLAMTDHGMSGKGEAGIGGPEEEMASAKQASDRNSSEPVEAAAVTKNAIAPEGTGQAKESHGGMGGPEEATTEYPPCSPGPGDDRCIQLYERGVGGSAKGSRAK
jgi:hypothetical protein